MSASANSCHKSAIWEQLTIAIPAYSRPTELIELLDSALHLNEHPGEILICEDYSNEREAIRAIAESFSGRFSKRGVTLTYHENSKNIGYDGNIRTLLALARRPWVMLIGNDDLLLPDAVSIIRAGVCKFPCVDMFSCAYLKFTRSLRTTIGCTRFSNTDIVFNRNNSDSGAIVRLSGFVGGLVFRREFSERYSTEKFDGTLYYQMYLAAHAYSQSGIAYLSAPMVASRVNNPPLFGSASAEQGVHKPGIYAAEGRAAMWVGIMAIGKFVGEAQGVALIDGIRRELSRRQSFHVYEKLSEQGRRAVWVFTKSISAHGLLESVRMRALVLVCLIFGTQSRTLFSIARYFQAKHYRSSIVSS